MDSLKIMLILVILSFLSIACEKEEVIPSKAMTFTIKKGSHNSLPEMLALVKEEKISFKATLTQSAGYFLDYENNQMNKLFGFSDCSTAHHENSARFGWMSINNRMAVYPYTYINGTRSYTDKDPIAEIELGREYTYHIRIRGNKYIFEVETPQGIKSQIWDRGCSGTKDIKYTLTPYFGGKTPAMHEMKIKVELL